MHFVNYKFKIFENTVYYQCLFLIILSVAKCIINTPNSTTHNHIYALFLKLQNCNNFLFNERP